MSIDTILRSTCYKNISFSFIVAYIDYKGTQTQASSLIIRFRFQVKGDATAAASARPRIIYNPKIAAYQLTHMIDARPGHVG